MLKSIQRSLILAGFASIGFISGYNVYVKIIDLGDTKKYVFKEYQNGILKSGFACNCKLNGNISSWVGSDFSACSGGIAKVRRILSAPPPPDSDACCLDRPRFKGRDLTGKSGSTCFY